MGEVTIDKYSHYFKVSGHGADTLETLRVFSLYLTHFGVKKRPDGRGYERVQGKVFAARTADKREYRFPITVLEHFLSFLDRKAFYNNHTTRIVEHPMYQPTKVDLLLNPTIVPRDYQKPIIRFTTLREDPAAYPIPKYRRVVPIQMGKGKTAIGLMTAAILGVRVGIVLLPRYINKWVDDVTGAFDKFPGSTWKERDVLAVRGGVELARVIEAAKNGTLKAKVIIFSNRTLAIYIKEYEEGLISDFYGCTPDKLFETLGIGLRLIDEVHQDFHSHFKLDMYTHVPLSIELSATLDPSDDFLKKMYKLMLPMEARYTGLVYDQYIAVTALFYYLENPKKIKHKRNGMYSHVVFEESLKKSIRTFNNYLRFIGDTTNRVFVVDYKPTQKHLVFCGKIETCQSVGEFLQTRFPHLKIGVYVGGSDDNILKESDIIVSTLQSCGTARDIPNLTSVVTTVASDTNQGNEQAMGRLRPIADFPDMVPQYYYFVCADIPKHVQYHRRKLKTFHGKAKSHSSVHTGVRI